MEKPAPILPHLSQALHRIRSTPPRIIASPRTQPRRAAVALIIRVVPNPAAPPPPPPPTPPTLTDFFSLPWVADPAARPEILFLRRAHPPPDEPSLLNARPRNTTEAHVAFPGGRTEDGDEGGLYTAMRQTWEEIGIDLAERDYTCVGQLDDREITTSLGKRLLMILSPFVFLQLTPRAPDPDPDPATTLHWTPLAAFADPRTPPAWSSVAVDAASRLAPRHSTALRLLVRALVGSMQFPALVIPAPHEQLKLWGLSLGMALDLMAYMVPPPAPGAHPPLPPALRLPYEHAAGLRVDVAAPSLASVFPRFSYPDVNFWIWVFGKRYRDVVRGWEASVRAGGSNDRRINWSGAALSTFYAAVRKALVVVIVGRALGVLFALALTGWWLFTR